MARPPAGRSGTDDLKARAIAWVERTCLDQGVPVKLSNRGTMQAVGLVTDVGFFLERLESEIAAAMARPPAV